MMDATTVGRSRPDLPRWFAFAAIAAERWARAVASGGAGVAKTLSKRAAPACVGPHPPGSADASRMHDVGLGVF
ncbi:hypothetical protein [Aureimonas leprariae]|uniref:Uncharacterized protein n=1 Tax=Plantimonas leprariae TaxID=2615207 RepID=A0A7V7TVI0_9HYPH|nr:hypothetical protein [Aureimonas leprariae]KAB0677798.1 hypothetical protein F6X38_17630 [Aureimonas leprariae]